MTFFNPNIGRRTGVDVKAGKNIKILDNGFEDFSDYWTDKSDGEDETFLKVLAEKENETSADSTSKTVDKPQKVRSMSPFSCEDTGELSRQLSRIPIDAQENTNTTVNQSETRTSEVSEHGGSTNAQSVSTNAQSVSTNAQSVSPDRVLVTEVENLEQVPSEVSSSSDQTSSKGASSDQTNEPIQNVVVVHKDTDLTPVETSIESSIESNKSVENSDTCVPADKDGESVGTSTENETGKERSRSTNVWEMLSEQILENSSQNVSQSDPDKGMNPCGEVNGTITAGEQEMDFDKVKVSSAVQNFRTRKRLTYSNGGYTTPEDSPLQTKKTCEEGFKKPLPPKDTNQQGKSTNATMAHPSSVTEKPSTNESDKVTELDTQLSEGQVHTHGEGQVEGQTDTTTTESEDHLENRTGTKNNNCEPENGNKDQNPSTVGDKGSGGSEREKTEVDITDKTAKGSTEVVSKTSKQKSVLPTLLKDPGIVPESCSEDEGDCSDTFAMLSRKPVSKRQSTRSSIANELKDLQQHEKKNKKAKETEKKNKVGSKVKLKSKLVVKLHKVNTNNLPSYKKDSSDKDTVSPEIEKVTSSKRVNFGISEQNQNTGKNSSSEKDSAPRNSATKNGISEKDSQTEKNSPSKSNSPGTSPAKGSPEMGNSPGSSPAKGSPEMGNSPGPSPAKSSPDMSNSPGTSPAKGSPEMGNSPGTSPAKGSPELGSDEDMNAKANAKMIAGKKLQALTEKTWAKVSKDIHLEPQISHDKEPVNPVFQLDQPVQTGESTSASDRRSSVFNDRAPEIGGLSDIQELTEREEVEDLVNNNEGKRESTKSVQKEKLNDDKGIESNVVGMNVRQQIDTEETNRVGACKENDRHTDKTTTLETVGKKTVKTVVKPRKETKGKRGKKATKKGRKKLVEETTSDEEERVGATEAQDANVEPGAKDKGATEIGRDEGNKEAGDVDPDNEAWKNPNSLLRQTECDVSKEKTSSQQNANNEESNLNDDNLTNALDKVPETQSQVSHIVRNNTHAIPAKEPNQQGSDVGTRLESQPLPEPDVCGDVLPESEAENSGSDFEVFEERRMSIKTMALVHTGSSVSENSAPNSQNEAAERGVLEAEKSPAKRKADKDEKKPGKASKKKYKMKTVSSQSDNDDVSSNGGKKDKCIDRKNAGKQIEKNITELKSGKTVESEVDGHSSSNDERYMKVIGTVSFLTNNKKVNNKGRKKAMKSRKSKRKKKMADEGGGEEVGDIEGMSDQGEIRPNEKHNKKQTNKVGQEPTGELKQLGKLVTGRNGKGRADNVPCADEMTELDNTSDNPSQETQKKGKKQKGRKIINNKNLDKETEHEERTGEDNYVVIGQKSIKNKTESTIPGRVSGRKTVKPSTTSEESENEHRFVKTKVLKTKSGESSETCNEETESRPTRDRSKDTEPGQTRGRSKDTEPGQTRGRSKDTEPGQIRGRSKDTEPGQTRGRSKDTEPGQIRGRSKDTEPGQTRGRSKDTEPGQTRGRSKDTEPGQTRGRSKKGQNLKTSKVKHKINNKKSTKVPNFVKDSLRNKDHSDDNNVVLESQGQNTRQKKLGQSPASRSDTEVSDEVKGKRNKPSNVIKTGKTSNSDTNLKQLNKANRLRANMRKPVGKRRASLAPTQSQWVRRSTRQSMQAENIIIQSSNTVKMPPSTKNNRVLNLASPKTTENMFNVSNQESLNNVVDNLSGSEFSPTVSPSKGQGPEAGNDKNRKKEASSKDSRLHPSNQRSSDLGPAGSQKERPSSQDLTKSGDFMPTPKTVTKRRRKRRLLSGGGSDGSLYTDSMISGGDSPAGIHNTPPPLHSITASPTPTKQGKQLGTDPPSSHPSNNTSPAKQGKQFAAAAISAKKDLSVSPGPSKDTTPSKKRTVSPRKLDSYMSPSKSGLPTGGSPSCSTRRRSLPDVQSDSNGDDDGSLEDADDEMGSPPAPKKAKKLTPRRVKGRRVSRSSASGENSSPRKPSRRHLHGNLHGGPSSSTPMQLTPGLGSKPPKSILKKPKLGRPRLEPNPSSPLPTGRNQIEGSYAGGDNNASSLSKTPQTPQDMTYFPQTPAVQPITPVTKKAVKIILPSPPLCDGVRRSQRIRVPTLEWYKGERIVYGRRKSGMGIMGLASPWRLEEERHEKRKHKTGETKTFKQARKKVSRHPTPKNMSVHTDPPSDLEMLEDSVIPIVNPQTQEEVFIECIKKSSSHEFVNPQGSAPTTTDPLVLCKVMKQAAFSLGILVIRPLEQKETQFVRKDTMIFIVKYGKIAVTVHRTMSILETDDTFFVPQGNTYSIKNLRNEEATLWYFQHKGDRAEGKSS